MCVLGAQTVWVSLSTPSDFAHVCATAQSAKRLGVGEYRSESVVINQHVSCCFQMTAGI